MRYPYTKKNRSQARVLAFALAMAPLTALPQLAHAAEAKKDAVADGVAIGRVVNAATQNYIANVEVKDEATGQTVVTDADGYFRMNVVPGSHTFLFSYTGLDPQKQTATIKQGDTVLRDVPMTSADYKDVVILQEVVVATEKEGRAASISQQKQADFMVNVISSDEFQNVAGGNVGDFLRNVPGISIEYSGADPRSISIRGMDPNMVGVNMNGMRAASASSANSTRKFELDQTSLQDVESIEIFKTPPAHIDADSGAGAINIVSKSAFKLKGRRIGYSALANMNSGDLTMGKTVFPQDDSNLFTHKIRPGGTLSYSESFFDRLGVVVTANYNEFYVNQHSFTTTYAATGSNATFVGQSTDGDTGIHMKQVSYSINPIITQRTSVSCNLDFKLSNETTLWFRSQVNTSLIDGGGRSMDFNVTDPSTTTGATTNGPAAGWTAYSVTALGNGVSTIADAGASTSSTYAHVAGEFLDKVGADTKFSLGSTTKTGPWKIDTGFSTSLSTNHYRNHGNMPVPQVDLYLRGISFRLDQPQGGVYPTITQISGPDMYDLSNYVSRVATSGTSTVTGTSSKITGYPAVTITNNQYAPFQLRNGRRAAGKDIFATGKVDVRRNFNTRFPTYIQAGLSMRQEDRTMDRAGQARWLYVGPDGTPGTADDYTSLNLAQFKSTKIHDTFAGFQTMPYYDLNAINQYFINNQNLFREDVSYRIETEGANDKKICEKVNAGYVEEGIKIRKLDILLGVRYERTSDWGRGRAVNNDAARNEAEAELLAYCKSQGYASVAATPSAVVSAFRADSAKISSIRYGDYVNATQTYGDIFPNLQLKYSFTPNFVTRLSYNRSIARQDFGNLMPGYSTSYDSTGLETITITNIKLKPVYFDNYDLSMEYYLKAGGVLSASFYDKEITNYTVNKTDTITAGVDYGYDLSGYIGDTIVYKDNSGKARHQGIELNYQQNLKYLNHHLQGFTLAAGYTYAKAKSRSSYGGTGTYNFDVPIVGAVPHAYNARLSYNYRKFSASVMYNWKSAYLNGVTTNTVTPNSILYSYWKARGSTDLNLAYQIYKTNSIFLEVKNVTNEPWRQYINTLDHYKYSVTNGAQIYLGFKGQF